MTDLRYPIGQFSFDPHVTADTRRAAIARIAAAPAAVRAAAGSLGESRLDVPYRPGGWTTRQVVHHLADSHMNAFVRFKLAMTEDNPTIKPYKEAAWAGLADSTRTPLDVSLALLEALHRRWVVLLESMTAADFARPLQHPDNGPMSLDRLLQMYAWHGEHHVAHIRGARGTGTS